MSSQGAKLGPLTLSRICLYWRKTQVNILFCYRQFRWLILEQLFIVIVIFDTYLKDAHQSLRLTY